MIEWFKHVLQYAKLLFNMARNTNAFYKIMADLIRNRLNSKLDDHTILGEGLRFRRVNTLILIEKCDTIIKKGVITHDQFKSISDFRSENVLLNKALSDALDTISKLPSTQPKEIDNGDVQ